jgi:6-phosphogluconolactonase (cycloisomerase 2 family)/urocanate hydratase
MILLRARRCASVYLITRKSVRALILLGIIGVLTACGWSSESSSSSMPPPAELTAIAVGPPDSSAAMGLSSQFTATGVFTDGSKRDLSSLVTWRSANSAAASISNTGLATAVGPGSTTISASLRRMTGSTTFNVTAANLVAIDVTPTNASIASGQTIRFTASGVYTDNSVHDLTASVIWSSSITTVGSISNMPGFNGMVTTGSPGSTTITATLGGVSASTVLTVTSATLVSIGVTPANPTIACGLADALHATGVYTDHSTHDLTSSVTWSSSDSTVASVSNISGSNGLSTATSPGSTTISATLGGVSGSTTVTVTAASLVSLGITPANSSIANGLKSQFTAIGTYTDNSTQILTAQVVWNSSNPSVAAVSNASGYDGLATALAPGSVTVTATLGAVSGSTGLTVTPATLVSIGVTPANPSIANGLTNQFIATGVYTDNTTQNLTASVAWTSSNTAVASVSNAPLFHGLAMGISAGSVIVTAATGNVSGSTGLTVTPATLVSIGVTPANPSIANGLTSQFIATGVYTDNSTQNITSSVAWTSSNTSVASVSNAAASQGLATGLSPGSVTITAATGGVSGTTGLTVTPAALVSIGVTPANPSIANGTNQQFNATGTYTDNSTQNLTTLVTWSSSDTSIASISNASNSNGLATALSQGSATITAALGSATGSTNLTVTPATLVSIAVTPPNSSIANGLAQQMTATGTYTDNSTQNLTASVTWASSNINIAAISNASGSTGLAVSLSQGTVTITASLGSVCGSTGLSITPATLVSIALIPANPSIASGTSQQFAATGTYTDSSTHDVTASVTWNSSDTTVASISNALGSNGLATSISQGAITITATLGTIVGSTGLNVTPAALVSIAVVPANSSIANGTSQQFAAIGTYTDNSTQPLTTSVTWSSSAAMIASISNASGSNGLATSTSQGSATITATLGTISGSTGLTVTAATLVSIAVTPAAPSIINGTTQQFTATGTFTDNSMQNLTASATWASSATTIAAISNAAGSSGLATAAAVGVTSISAAVGTVTSPSATLTVTAAPQYAYAANQNANTLSTYTIGAGGVLTANGTVATGQEPNAVVEDSAGRYVYVANWIDNTLSEYTIGTGGSLTAIGTVATGANPASIAVDPTSSYVYVANLASSTVSQYTIGAAGALTAIGTLASGNGPACLTVDPTGPYVYVANQNSNNVSQYTIGAGGVLSFSATVAAGNFPQSVAVDPSGRYAYVANYSDGTISEYTIGTGGMLAAIGTVPAGNSPESLTVDPNGQFVYAANHGDNTVSEYQIGPGGALTAIGTIAAGSGPWFITIDASGRYVYVANFNDNTVSEYTVGAGGVLSFTGTAATGSGPNAFDTGF